MQQQNGGPPSRSLIEASSTAAAGCGAGGEQATTTELTRVNFSDVVITNGGEECVTVNTAAVAVCGGDCPEVAAEAAVAIAAEAAAGKKPLETAL